MGGCAVFKGPVRKGDSTGDKLIYGVGEWEVPIGSEFEKSRDWSFELASAAFLHHHLD